MNSPRRRDWHDVQDWICLSPWRVVFVVFALLILALLLSLEVAQAFQFLEAYFSLEQGK